MPERNFNSLEAVGGFAFDWGNLTLTCGPRVNGAARFGAGVVHLPSGQGHRCHNPPGAAATIHVPGGTGAQMLEDADGTPAVQQVGQGRSVFGPESRFHPTLDTGKAKMRRFVGHSLTGAESLTGPEEALRSLPDFRLIPPGAAS